MTFQTPIHPQERPGVERGWIEHGGGDCPLPYETLVHLRFRSGMVEDKACFAGFWRTSGQRNWWRRRTGPMGTWMEQSANDCITHYRLVLAPSLPARIDSLAEKRRGM